MAYENPRLFHIEGTILFRIHHAGYLVSFQRFSLSWDPDFHLRLRVGSALLRTRGSGNVFVPRR